MHGPVLRALPRDPRPHRAPGRAAVAGRSIAAVDARGEPGALAPRAHHLVLRDLRARAVRARAPAVRSALQGAVQLLLRGGRRPARERSPRAALAAGVRGGEPLAPAGRRADRTAAGKSVAADPRAADPRPQPRAATPGA